MSFGTRVLDLNTTKDLCGCSAHQRISEPLRTASSIALSW